jgi:hypothetical protein
MLRSTRTGDGGRTHAEVRAGTMRRKGPAARLVVLYAAAFILASIVLIADAPPKTNQFLAELYRLRHVLFFGIGGLIVLELTALVGRRWIRKRSLYYLVAGLSVACASLGLEILYPPAAGFSAERLVRNIFGGIAFLTLSAALDHPLRREHDWLRGRPRRLIGWTSAAVLTLVMQSLIPVAVSYAGRSGAYPRVVDMTEAWQQRFIEPRNALLFVGMPPESWESRNQRTTAMILFEATPDAGVMVQEPYSDWRGYNTLQLQIYSLLDAPKQVELRVEDKRTERSRGDRTDLILDVAPGYNLYEIPMGQIRSGPHGRDLRLNKIRRVGLFSPGSDAPFMLFLSDFRLVDRPRSESPGD